MEELTVFRNGFQDSLNLLDDDEMSFVMGGNTGFISCGKGYSYDSAGHINCNCKYSSSPLPITSTDGGNNP